jgi:NDP-sugar pyrophosphorylase family protein
VLGRLHEAGVSSLIVNTHHFADQVEAWLKANDCGVRVAVSREDELLDTGGGLKKAASFFEGETHFLVHNVDVLSDIDLADLARDHQANGALASLAVMERKASRYLMIDAGETICGRRRGEDGEVDLRREPFGELEALGFCGIQVLSTEFLDQMPPVSRYSITDTYLDLAGAGRDIRGIRVDGSKWRDCGRPEDLRGL